MILAKTLAPELLEAIAIGPNIEYLKTNTSLCELANEFPIELNLMYKWKETLQSSTPLDALRDFSKEYIFAGPELDTQTLVYFKHKIDTFADTYKQSVLTEMEVAFYKASKIRGTLYNVKPFISGVAIDKDQNFLDRLADALKGCFAPCNYLDNVSDAVGTYSNINDMPSGNTAPIWDTASELIQVPIQMSVNTFNKVSTALINEIVTLSQFAEQTFKSGSSVVYNKKQADKEKAIIESGEVNTTGSSNILQSDTDSYIQAGAASTQILANTKVRTGDCFRIVDNLKRFNYQDANMNLGNPKQFKFVVNNEGYQDVIDLMGRAIPEAPFSGSYKDLMVNLPAFAYQFDDGVSNWNTGGGAAPALSDGNQFETFNNSENAINSELPATGTIDSYGTVIDPTMTNRIDQGLSTSNTKLDEFSMAVSPDVERQFASNNIQKGDYVQIVLDNGTRIVRRYDDTVNAVYDGEQPINQYKLYKGTIVGNVVKFNKANVPSEAPQTWENGVPLELQPN